MKKLLVTCFIVVGFCGFSQDQNLVGRHTVSFETGIFNRGLAGLGYNYNFNSINGNGFISLHGSGGIGLGFDGRYNYYFTAAPSINFGVNAFYFAIGLEAKFLRQALLSYESLFDGSGAFQGFGGGPFVGLGIFAKEGFTLKIRGGLTYRPGLGDKDPILTGAGISLGYSFGK